MYVCLLIVLVLVVDVELGELVLELLDALLVALDDDLQALDLLLDLLEHVRLDAHRISGVLFTFIHSVVIVSVLCKIKALCG